MNNSMIYLKDSGERVLASCAACINAYLATDNLCQVEIPEFYSIKHVTDSGWIATKDPLYCPPEEEFVWICPDCVKEIKDGKR